MAIAIIQARENGGLCRNRSKGGGDTIKFFKYFEYRVKNICQ